VTWKENYKTLFHFADQNEVIKASGMMKYLQETANRALAGFGHSYKMMTERDMCFILSKSVYRQYRSVGPFEDIEVTTWDAENSGIMFVRNYTVEAAGEPVLEMASHWVLFSISQKKVLRPAELYYAPQPTLTGVSPEVFYKLHCPPDMERVSEYRAGYADIDLNGHMNNTAFLDLICEALGGGMRGNYLSEVSLHYICEICRGDEVALYKSDAGARSYFIKGVKNDGKTCFEALVKLEEIKR